LKYYVEQMTVNSQTVWQILPRVAGIVSGAKVVVEVIGLAVILVVPVVVLEAAEVVLVKAVEVAFAVVTSDASVSNAED
jgi:hypothetical protein